MTSDDGIAAGLSKSEIAGIVSLYIIDEFLLGSGAIDEDASLLESRVVDSTGIVALATFIEVRFEIEIDDDDMTTANFDSIRRIARFVAGKQRTACTGVRAVE